MLIHWIAPMLLGIYFGILVGPVLRAWVASKEWEREARAGSDWTWSVSSEDADHGFGHDWPTDAHAADELL